MLWGDVELKVEKLDSLFLILIDSFKCINDLSYITFDYVIHNKVEKNTKIERINLYNTINAVFNIHYSRNIHFTERTTNIKKGLGDPRMLQPKKYEVSSSIFIMVQTLQKLLYQGIDGETTLGTLIQYH